MQTINLDYFYYNYSDIVTENIKNALIAGSSEYFYFVNNIDYYQFYIWSLIHYAGQHDSFRIHISSDYDRELLQVIISEINAQLWMIYKLNLNEHSEYICVDTLGF